MDRAESLPKINPNHLSAAFNLVDRVKTINKGHFNELSPSGSPIG